MPSFGPRGINNTRRFGVSAWHPAVARSPRLPWWTSSEGGWRRGRDSPDEASAVHAIALPASSPPDALLKSRFSSCSSAAAPVRIPRISDVKNHGGEGGIRTLEAGISHLRDFQSRSFGQLGHLSSFESSYSSGSIVPAFAPCGKKKHCASAFAPRGINKTRCFGATADIAGLLQGQLVGATAWHPAVARSPRLPWWTSSEGGWRRGRDSNPRYGLTRTTA